MKTALFSCVSLACASAALAAQIQTNPAAPNPTNPAGPSSGSVQTGSGVPTPNSPAQPLRPALHSDFRSCRARRPRAHQCRRGCGSSRTRHFPITKPRLGAEHQRHLATIHDVVVDSVVEPLAGTSLEPDGVAGQSVGVAERSVGDAVEPGRDRRRARADWDPAWSSPTGLSGVPSPSAPFGSSSSLTPSTLSSPALSSPTSPSSSSAGMTSVAPAVRSSTRRNRQLLERAGCHPAHPAEALRIGRDGAGKVDGAGKNVFPARLVDLSKRRRPYSLVTSRRRPLEEGGAGIVISSTPLRKARLRLFADRAFWQRNARGRNCRSSARCDSSPRAPPDAGVGARPEAWPHRR